MKTLILGCLIVITFALLSLLGKQRILFSPHERIRDLEANLQARVLKNWKISFYNCPPSIKNVLSSNVDLCKPSEMINQDISLPFRKNKLSKPIPQALVGFRRVAVLSYSLNMSDRAFLGVKNQLDAVYLIIPGQQNFITKLTYPIVTSSYGNLVDARFFLPNQLLLKSNRIDLVFEGFQDDSIGPLQFAPMLVKALASEKILDFGKSEELAAQLTRQIDIGLPFVIAALGLVIDHTKTLPSLALFGAARGIRSYIYGVYEFEKSVDAIPLVYLLISSLNILSALALVYFFSTLTGIRFSRSLASIVLVSAGVMSASIFIGLKNPIRDYWTIGDLVFDTLLALSGTVVLANFHFQSQLSKQVPQSKHNRGSAFSIRDESLAAIGIRIKNPWQKTLQFGLIYSGLLLTAWINADNLLSILQDSTPDVYDWKHLAMIPLMLIAAFLDVGSTLKTIQAVGNAVKQRALIDRDIEISRRIQKDILPPRKLNSDEWQWRSLHFTASTLAGDWHDIREITLVNGQKVLVACIVDVTGHGISSALMTSNIASHWSLWCNDLQNASHLKTCDDLANFLSHGPLHIHRGLMGLRYNLGCSMAAMIYNPSSRNLHFLTAGHPGLLLCENRQLSYLFSQGSKPGVPCEQPNWQVKTRKIASGDAELYLYTDGLTPNDQPISRWIKQLERQWLESKAKNLHALLVRQFRQNHRQFRKDPESEDDVTILILSFPKSQKPPI